jgi:predicted Zn finger-like uncharacterized protein
MRIRATCDSCSNQFLVKETSAGKRVKCPECGDPVQIPDGDEEQYEAPARKSGSKSRGKGKKQAANQNGMLIGVGAGVGGALVIGLLIAALSGSGNNQLSAPPPIVQPMTAQPSTPMAPIATPVATAGTQPAPQMTPSAAHRPAATEAPSAFVPKTQPTAASTDVA